MEITTSPEAIMSDKKWDDLYFATIEGTPRDERVAKFGEANVSFAETHPVVKAALAYRARTK